ncbi:MAG: type II secretion system protein N [Pseudomonadales bacterium]|nr:type II secretion system protein N [Pseudomonadales bacterium]
MSLIRLSGFCFVALISFLGFLLVRAPAAPIWSLLNNNANTNANQPLPDLQVLLVSGTVWDGLAELQYRDFPNSLLSWQLMPFISTDPPSTKAATEQDTSKINPAEDNTIIPLAIDLDLSAKGIAHHLMAEVVAKSNKIVITNLRGDIGSTYINAISQPQGLTFSGAINVGQINLASDLKWLQQANGTITWPGGKITSRAPDGATQVFNLPALDGIISLQSEILGLEIQHNNEPLINIELKQDGWIRVKVKARIFDLARLPWPSGTNLDDTVLEFEEQVF